MLCTGQKAPDFSAPDQDGNIVSLADFAGKKLILYFYPEDNTPTCTVQACNLRDNYQKLRKQGYQLLGISPDSAKKHTNFIKKYNLPFSLLADEDLKICKAYKVWAMKKLFGHEYMGVLRTSFVVNEEGKIERVIEKVVSKEHANQLLKPTKTQDKVKPVAKKTR